jgi:hypothetical protein
VKGNKIAVIAVASALLGGAAVAAYYETYRGRPNADDALVSLSQHASIIGLIDKGDTRNASKFLTLLADADVMRLMEARGGYQSSTDYRRRVLSSYGEFRRKNPELYGVPDYVDQSGRAEYEQNLKNIQTFLDSAGQSQPKSIKNN